MPPPPQPTRGLQPSILDRLIDPESAGTAIMTGYTIQKMYDAVLRDLEDLLNSVHTAHTISPEFPETRDYVDEVTRVRKVYAKAYASELGPL